jgi:hypothetical protein
MAAAKPIARGESGLLINVLISALVVIALIPSAILLVQLWRDMMLPHSVTLPVPALRTAEPPRPAGLDYPKKDASRFEVADNDGEDPASPPVVATTDEVPHGVGGWSWTSDQTGALPLPAPAPSSPTSIVAGHDAGDSPVLAQPETVPSTDPSPAETKTADAAPSNPFEQTERTEQPEVAAAVPLPQRKPNASAGTQPTVRTVKVVTIEAPQPSRPHDGAYALGSPAEAPAEWMETKTAVDMHAKSQQSSETVKIAEGGTKLRVTARDKNWVQVTDPASSTTGWIYNRFLQPTEPPAEKHSRITAGPVVDDPQAAEPMPCAFAARAMARNSRNEMPRRCSSLHSAMRRHFRLSHSVRRPTAASCG